MTDEIALGPGDEFDAIRALLRRWGDLATGIGDDAAVMRLARGDQLVVSVDAAVENRHFRRGWLTPREIGYRAVTAALSDLAAMAARPVGVLVAVTIPEAWRDALLEIGDGVGDAVSAARTVIRGGNITGGTELSITTTVLGEVYRPLRRSGATVGERIFVTGRFGGPGAALRALEAGADPGVHRDRFARPVARLAESRWLADAGASAAIDVSDGLRGDLRHLAAGSGVTLEVEGARLPLVDGVSIDEALASGEEYELIVSAPGALDARAFADRFGVPLTEIGRVTAGPPGDVIVHGTRVANAAGHDHLSR